ncbi:LapA family protein [Candidatus Woesebacteria bacterium]|nr:LapA family protein [Candidatus Woesebacteria bacterium]
MLSLIFLIVVGTGITFLSMQNTAVVSLNFLDYTFPDLPIYYVIIGSLLAGVVLAYSISFINSISTYMLIRTQHKKISKERKEVAELTKRVHQLELENVGLKVEHDPKSVDQKSL